MDDGGFLLQARYRNFEAYRSPEGEVFNSQASDRGFMGRFSHALGAGDLTAGWQSSFGRDTGRPDNRGEAVRTSYPEEDSHRLTVSYDLDPRAGFSRLGLVCGQVLLSQGDFDDRLRYLNLRGTLTTLLRRGVVPVINENDAVSTEELALDDAGPQDGVDQVQRLDIDELHQPFPKADMDRLSQSQGLAHRLLNLGRHGQGDLGHRVARGQPQQQEDDQRNEQERWDGDEQSSNRVAQHGRPG